MTSFVGSDVNRIIGGMQAFRQVVDWTRSTRWESSSVRGMSLNCGSFTIWTWISLMVSSNLGWTDCHALATAFRESGRTIDNGGWSSFTGTFECEMS